MFEISGEIRKRARVRIAEMLCVPVDDLDMQMKFQDFEEIQTVSILSRNKFDRILDDIRDVADSKTLRKLEKGEHKILTIEDYLNHMVACYKENPKMVTNILGEI